MKRIELFKKFNNITLTRKSKILLLTHTDMDGSGVVVLLKSIFPYVEVIHCPNSNMDQIIYDYTTNKETFENYDIIFITDISCSEETAKQIIKSSFAKDKVVLLDHHKTATYLNRYDFAVVTNENPEDGFNIEYFPSNTNGLTSGTSLMLEFLLHNGFSFKNEKLVKLFSHMVAAYDTWDWVYVFNKSKTYSNLNALYYILGVEFFENNFIKKFTNVNMNQSLIDLFSSMDNYMLEIEENKIKEYCERKEKCIQVMDMTIAKKKYSIAFVSGENHLSRLFETMNNLYPNVDVYIINTGNALSFRTRKDDIDVAEIAKIAGGGGHTQASGCKVNSDLLTLIITHTLKTNKFKNLLTLLRKEK